jgi:hypothetical protein
MPRLASTASSAPGRSSESCSATQPVPTAQLGSVANRIETNAPAARAPQSDSIAQPILAASSKPQIEPTPRGRASHRPAPP